MAVVPKVNLRDPSQTTIAYPRPVIAAATDSPSSVWDIVSTAHRRFSGLHCSASCRDVVGTWGAGGT